MLPVVKVFGRLELEVVRQSRGGERESGKPYEFAPVCALCPCLLTSLALGTLTELPPALTRKLAPEQPTLKTERLVLRPLAPGMRRPSSASQVRRTSPPRRGSFRIPTRPAWPSNGSGRCPSFISGRR